MPIQTSTIRRLFSHMCTSKHLCMTDFCTLFSFSLTRNPESSSNLLYLCMIVFLCTAMEFATLGLIVCPSATSSSAIGDSFPYPFVSIAYACLLCCSLSIFSSLFPSFWSYSSHISSFDLSPNDLQSLGNPLILTMMVMSNLSVAYQDVSLRGSLMCVFSFDEEQTSLSLSLLQFLFLLLPLSFKCPCNRRFVKSDIDVLSSSPGELPYPV